ncbi:hypothetical protein PHYSODRAFT_310533 [Phytophthora sojae]|uniref:DDE Tnp4 domain-containing protein n=1 Tax=Phytophthora sojae (strain P6497) TaxID=1094619 RepID=G4Z0T7_PHYSP|nr:hypothetical protein PHYSODRAFT_310533 [Phytophthora sojae]EGZ22776.1 hypothetical protein PHYSODRAFT_310533 [Phytophthora sojae]|eukprot:XP_009518064.1 hypothetical protein PHYSODRAFT_310533 [Phytophthora sojae]
MMNDIIYFPAPTADAEWDDMVDGFYDKSGKPSYNCLAAIDYRNKFRYIGVFSGSKHLTRKQRCYNYHLFPTRIHVECVFSKLKARFKVIHGVMDRRSYTVNARMTCVAAVLHNLLVDIGDKEEFDYTRNDDEREQARVVMNAYNPNWDRTQAEVELAERK